MTHIIEGKLLREEKPERYLNRYIDFKRIENIRNGSRITKKRVLTTTSEKFANYLNRKGYDLQWNEDLERAIEMCERRELKISETRLFTPKIGWDNYLTQEFGETDEEKTINGEIKIWKELRLPTPWLYIASFGKLKNNFIFDSEKFIVEPNVRYKGNRSTIGAILDTPFRYFGISYSKTNTKKYI